MPAEPLHPPGAPLVAAVPVIGPLEPNQPADASTVTGVRALTPKKAAARRTMFIGVVWFVVGIVVSFVTIAVTSAAGSPGVIVWGVSLYGVVQVVRGAIAYGRA